jgi:WD40 repeat protein
VSDIDELLAKPELLISSEPAQVLELLNDRRDPRALFVAAVYRASVGVHERMSLPQRRQVLSMDAARLGDRALAARLATARLPDVAPAAWIVNWASGSLTDYRHLRCLTGHGGPVIAVATAAVHGKPVAVTGSRDKTLRVWDLTTGEQMFESGTRHTDPISSQRAEVVDVVSATCDGRPAVITRDAGGSVLVWDLETGQNVGEFMRVLDGPPQVLVTMSADRTVYVWSLSTGRLMHALPSMAHLATLNGRRVLVTAEPDGVTHVWDLVDGRRIGACLPVTKAVMIDGRPVAQVAQNDRSMFLWDLATGRPVGDPQAHLMLAQADDDTLDITTVTVVDGRVITVTLASHETHLLGDHPSSIPALGTDTALLEGRHVAVTLEAERSLRMWDLTAGPLYREGMRVLATVEPTGRPVVPADSDVRLWDLVTDRTIGHPHAGRLPGVSPGTPAARAVLDGREVVLTVEKDHTVQVRDSETGRCLDQVLTGHTDRVLSLAAVAAEGRNLAVTTALDGTVRLWDLDSRQQEGPPLTGHIGQVWDVATTVVGGRPVAVTAGADHSVHTWDLGHAGVSAAHPRAGHTRTITAVGTAVLRGQPVAITAGADATVRIWDLATGREAADPLTGSVGKVCALTSAVVSGRTVVITAGPDTRIHMHDLATGRLIGEPILSGHARVTAMTCAEVNRRTVLVTSGTDPAPRLWDLATAEPVGTALTGHSSRVTAVSTTQLDGRPVAVTAGWDNTVRLWDLSTSRQIGDPLTGHTDWVTSVSAVQTKEGPVAVSRSRDGTLRLWDLTTGQQTASTTLDTTTGCQTVSATVRDGRPLAVTAEADRIRMWNPASGRRIETVYVLPQPACALTTAPGGQLLVAFGTDIASLRRTER